MFPKWTYKELEEALTTNKNRPKKPPEPTVARCEGNFKNFAVVATVAASSAIALVPLAFYSVGTTRFLPPSSILLLLSPLLLLSILTSSRLRLSSSTSYCCFAAIVCRSSLLVLLLLPPLVVVPRPCSSPRHSSLFNGLLLDGIAWSVLQTVAYPATPL